MTPTDTAGVPRFGPVLNPRIHKHHMEHLDAEMYIFVVRDKTVDMDVNLLHLTTDLNAARPEMSRVVEFMTNTGYSVEVENNMSLSYDDEMYWIGHDTDVLFIGNRCKDVTIDPPSHYVLRALVMGGWFGLIPYWDVLWYGLDIVPQLPKAERYTWTQRFHPPQRTDMSFGSFACGLLHGHILRRNDLYSICGAAVTLLSCLEVRFDRMFKDTKGLGRKATFGRKFEKFQKDVLTGKEKDSKETQLFIRAVNILKDYRDVSAHDDMGMPAEWTEENRKKSADTIDNFIKYSGDERWKLWANDTRHTRNYAIKWRYRLAHMAAAWLDEYGRDRRAPR